ncbi:hypothetical protein HDU84_002290 [Entophlyctis sp. JEL0112]|nr:hypothetical protein HDU84_002290 [Entophlyctis sp. JEL0112]
MSTPAAESASGYAIASAAERQRYQQPPPQQQQNSRRSRRLQLVMLLVLPSVIPSLVSGLGGPLYAGYLVATAPVIYCLAVEWRRTARVTPAVLVVALPTLAGLAVQVGLAAAFPANNDDTAARLRSIGTAVPAAALGVAFLVSLLLAPRPNLIDLFVADNSSGAAVNDDPALPAPVRERRRRAVKRGTTIMCVVWGLGNLCISAVILVVDFLAPTNISGWVQIGVSFGGLLILGGITQLFISAAKKRQAAAAVAAGAHTFTPESGGPSALEDGAGTVMVADSGLPGAPYQPLMK